MPPWPLPPAVSVLVPLAALLQSAAVGMPRTKVPLTLQLHKLMNPQRGIGGILQLPVRVAGLPLTAAASGAPPPWHAFTGDVS